MSSKMQKDCVKKMKCSTSDIISNLPGNVREEILMCMPLQDAARTCVLSRKWRYAWMTLPQLVFDHEFYRKSRSVPENELMMIIFRVLLLHRGPILKVKLYMNEPESWSDIDQLILFLSNNGIQEFNLDIWGEELYKLPSSIFLCQQLKHLKLRLCSFNPLPTFKGFSSLLSLKLDNVDITSEVFSSLIFNCPLLEKLKIFHVKSYCYLEITAPNLRCLFCTCESISLHFKDTPKLARVSLDTFDSVYGKAVSQWVTLFAGLPVIEFLELTHEVIKLIPADGVPRRLPTNLNHLKILKLYNIFMGSANEVSSILCLIRSSPNLEKITVVAYMEDLEVSEQAYMEDLEVSDPVQKLLEEQVWWDISLNRLRKVELKVFCTVFELEFIKVLLATSPNLEKMVILPHSNLDSAKLGFWKKMTQFKRLSPRAEVFYEIREQDYYII